MKFYNSIRKTQDKIYFLEHHNSIKSLLRFKKDQTEVYTRVPGTLFRR